MKKLDDLINEKYDEYLYLRNYKEVLESGTCNNCEQLNCKYKPDVGELVRYNCPFYTHQVIN